MGHPSHTGQLAGDGGDDAKSEMFLKAQVLRQALALGRVDMKENRREAFSEVSSNFSCSPHPTETTIEIKD